MASEKILDITEIQLMIFECLRWENKTLVSLACSHRKLWDLALETIRKNIYIKIHNDESFLRFVKRIPKGFDNYCKVTDSEKLLLLQNRFKGVRNLKIDINFLKITFEKEIAKTKLRYCFDRLKEYIQELKECWIRAPSLTLSAPSLTLSDDFLTTIVDKSYSSLKIIYLELRPLNRDNHAEFQSLPKRVFSRCTNLRFLWTRFLVWRYTDFPLNSACKIQLMRITGCLYICPKKIDNFISKATSLKEIRIDFCCEKLLKTLAASCPDLNKLSIEHCHDYLEPVIWQIIKKCNSLRYLVLANSNTISDEFIYKLAKFKTNLGGITLRNIYNISDESLIELITQNKKINNVSLCICTNVGEKFL